MAERRVASRGEPQMDTVGQACCDARESRAETDMELCLSADVIQFEK